jgi:hypothetical protein
MTGYAASLQRSKVADVLGQLAALASIDDR